MSARDTNQILPDPTVADEVDKSSKAAHGEQEARTGPSSAPILLVPWPLLPGRACQEVTGRVERR